MKNIFILLLSSTLILNACAAQPEPESVPEIQKYTWEEYDLSFAVPEGLVVIDQGQSLILDTYDITKDGAGDNPGYFRIHAYSDTTMEEAVTKFSDQEQFEQGEFERGGKNYTKITYYSEFGHYTAENYLIEDKDNIYLIYKSWIGTSTQLELILESLEF
ncbi:MAG: hypothetical protein WC777_01235 [Candidatus Gracilibacteria bacterium]|jgi:hypothetical protein